MYISSHTPFISAVRRVRKLLDKSLRATTGAATRNNSLQARVEALQRRSNNNNNNNNTARRGAQHDDNDDDVVAPLAVTVLGTGKAVEKALGVASWFEQEGDCHVRLETKTVTTVDDIVMQGPDEVDESRARRVSGLEVVVTLK